MLTEMAGVDSVVEGQSPRRGEGPKLLDADALMDDIIAKKGPQPYKGGLSEDNWEQVLAWHGGQYIGDCIMVEWWRYMCIGVCVGG